MNSFPLLEAFKLVCAHTKMVALAERSVQYRGPHTYYLTERFRLNETDDRTRLVVITDTEHFTVEGTRFESCVVFEGAENPLVLLEIARKIVAEQEATVARVRRAEQKRQVRETINTIDSVIADLSRARTTLMELR